MKPLFPLIPPPKKLWAIVLICFSSIWTIEGQTINNSIHEYQDVVLLKNGWEIRGNITRQEEDGEVAIESAGNLFIFQKDEIENLQIKIIPRQKVKWDERPIKPRKDLIFREKGLYHAIHLGILVQNADNPFEQSNGSVTTQTSHGYRFNRYLGVGAGIGLTMIREGHSVPVFGEVRGDLLKKPITPHYYFQGGYNIPAFQRDPRTQWGPDGPVEVQPETTGGRMIEAGVGIRIHTASQVSWTLTLGYREQVLNERIKHVWGNMDEFEVVYRRLSFQLGMMF